MASDLEKVVKQSIESLLVEMQTPSYRQGAASVGESAESLAAGHILGMFKNEIATDGKPHSAKYINALRDIDHVLRVPAAEYVPAIGDAFKIIDRVLPGEGGKASGS